ncbi:MAG: hypothetical protein Fur005_41470 [Roseiflexaceae bacterium]
MRYRFLWLAALLLASMLAVPVVRADEEPADIQLKLWPNPSSAARGDIVRYDLTVTNEAAGKASRTRVTLPIPRGQLSFVKVELLEKSTWVMELSEERIVIMFGTLRSGEKREARVFLKVEPTASDGVIKLRTSARYDEDDGQRIRSNETALTIVGTETDTKPAVVVEPAAGPVGTIFRFMVRNYFPEEQIFTWLNTPTGVAETRLNDRATEQGVATLDLESTKLAPGSYSLVVYGATSKITMVVPFEVK